MLTQPEFKPEPTWWTTIRLLRWDKPEGRLILMIPALWAAVLSTNGTPPLPLIGIIILGTLATSAGGCVVNDLWDRNIDPKVERTRNRPLAARTIPVQTAIAIAVVAFAIALACALLLVRLYLSPLTLWLSIAAVPVILFYPSAKRIFPLPQLVLSIAWGFAVLISWSAATAALEGPTWLLWAATLFWTLGFDTIYAMADRDDDRKIGVRSSALFFGNFAPHAVGLFFAATALFLAAVGWTMQLQIGFWLALALGCYGWMRQYLRLRHPHLSRRAFGQMFRQNVWIGFILLVGMIAGSLF